MSLEMSSSTLAATTFLDNHVSHLHPVFEAQNNRYDPAQRKYVPATEQDKFDEMIRRLHEEEFIKQFDLCHNAMKAFLKSREGFANPNSNQSPFASWNDVLEELENAKARWKDKEKGAWGRVRKSGRDMGPNARYVSPWLDLLPNTNCGSLVCGGLRLILGAMIAGADTREVINACVESIPETLEEANEILRLYINQASVHNTVKLKIFSLKLSTKILELVQCVIRWLDKHPVRKIIAAFAKQSEYSREITEAITEVQRESEQLRCLAYMCSQEVILETKTFSKESLSTGLETHTICTETHSVAKSIQSSTEEALSKISSMEATLEDKIARRLDEQICRSKTFTSQLLIENIKKSTWAKEFTIKMENISKAIASAPAAPQIILVQSSQPTVATRETLLDFLNIDGNTAREALEQASREGFQDEHRSVKLLQTVLQHPRFRLWLRSGQSDILILRQLAVEAEYALTFRFLVATLIETLMQTNGAIVLHFFCHMHYRSSRKRSFLLLRSLIYQLLHFSNHAKFTLEELIYDPQQLKEIFFRLLFSLQPGQTIFLIIHGLAYYETENEAETMLLLQIMDYLASDQRLRFKVLLSPPVPIDTARMLPLEAHLDLIEDNDSCQDYGLMSMMGMMNEAMMD